MHIQAIVVLLRPDVFLANVGYSNRTVTVQELFTTMLVELAVEFCVDIMALNKEINKASIPVHEYRTWLTKDIVLAQVFAAGGTGLHTVFTFITP